MTEPRILGGRYELGELLGYGGMAEVHRGRDVRLGRDVAVKVLRSDLARDPVFQSRFRREAQSAASLNHPSIVAVYDTGEDDEGSEPVPYIVMEYVEGQTLRDLMRGDGRLTPQRALEITAGVCEALEYSHRAGIVHRDIKPGNVMLTPAGAVKVMDFGIARAVTAATATMTQTAAVIGTAQYLSPEQARGEHVDARSDVYSAGCLLYELLTGQPPFTGDSPVAVAYQHVREDPVPPSRLDPELTPSIDAIVLKALAKNPANRYQSSADMHADIERVLAGRPVLATPVLDEATTVLGSGAAATTVMPAAERERRTNRALAYVLLTLLVLAVLVGAFFLARGLFGGGGTKVGVPQLIGKQVASAEHELTALGLRFEEKTVNRDRPAGQVVDQSPEPGVQVNKGDTVTLTVSAGVAQVRVPVLKGLSDAAARQALNQAGLALGNVTQKDSSQDAGTVLSSSPPAGQKVGAGTRVNLVEASGNVTVPSVVGLTEDAAINKLTAKGFQYDVTHETTSSATPGTVVRQDPSGSNTAPLGTIVHLVVADAPSTTPPPSPTTTTPPPTTTTPPTTPPTTSPSDGGGGSPPGP
jgi:serine/threonine-protein kinase